MKGKAGEAYNVGGPDECENIEVVKRVIELTGGDESLIEYVTDRPGHDRRYSLSSEKLKRGARLGGPGPLRRGPREDRRLVPRQRGLVGPDPLRRVPRVLRKAVRQERSADAASAADQARRASSWSSRRSTATSAASCVETFSRDAWAELGVDAEFVQHNHSRSSKGTLRGLHFQTEPGQAKLVRCPRGAILDVAVDLRRDSPTYGQWEAPRARRREATASSSSRSASATASPCSATSPTSPTSSPASTTRLTEAGIAWDDPEVGVDWQVAEPLLSERDKSAPKLAEIAETLPF